MAYSGCAVEVELIAEPEAVDKEPKPRGVTDPERDGGVASEASALSAAAAEILGGLGVVGSGSRIRG